jgi:hypothetical protein
MLSGFSSNWGLLLSYQRSKTHSLIFDVRVFLRLAYYRSCTSTENNVEETLEEPRLFCFGDLRKQRGLVLGGVPADYPLLRLVGHHPGPGWDRLFHRCRPPVTPSPPGNECPFFSFLPKASAESNRNKEIFCRMLRIILGENISRQIMKIRS